MTMSRNLVAGLVNSSWSALIGFAAVPYYVQYLGIEAYGLIGFFVTMQSVLALLDMGMTPTISREVARCFGLGKPQEAGKLLHTLAVIYWSIACIIFLFLLLVSSLIAKYWLQFNQLSSDAILYAIILMGFIVALRFPIGLYQGVLIGAQRVTISSSINIVMTSINHGGALIILINFSSTIEAFFFWQAFIAINYIILIRWAAWKTIGKQKNLKFNIEELKKVWKFSIGMSGVAFSAIILMQLDKLILSKVLNLDDFGKYILASIAASALYIILTPTFNVIYPRLSSLVATEDTEKIIYIYRTGTQILSAVLFSTALTAIFLSENIIYIWIGEQSLASDVSLIFSLLLIGTTLNGIMHFPYALQLAYGVTRIPIIINTVLVLVMVPLVVILTLYYGAVGGATAWVVLNVFYLFFGTFITHKYLLKNIGFVWILRDVIIPFVISLAIIILIYYSIIENIHSNFNKLLMGLLSAIVSFFLIALSSLRLRKAAMTYFYKTN